MGPKERDTGHSKCLLMQRLYSQCRPGIYAWRTRSTVPSSSFSPSSFSSSAFSSSSSSSSSQCSCCPAGLCAWGRVGQRWGQLPASCPALCPAQQRLSESSGSEFRLLLSGGVLCCSRPDAVNKRVKKMCIFRTGTVIHMWSLSRVCLLYLFDMQSVCLLKNPLQRSAQPKKQMCWAVGKQVKFRMCAGTAGSLGPH